jgi:hypothetical protein
MSESAFDAALAELYLTFSAPRPRSVECCPCCEDPRNYDAILTKPLRNLTANDVDAYVISVFGTVGGPNDFRYLLPRLLELSASAGNDVLEPQAVTGALPRADWTTWRKAERDAIMTFFSAWFDRVAVGCAEEEVYARGVEPVLCGMARAGVDIAPYLNRLHRPENLGGLVELLEWGEQQKSKLCPFWEHSPTAWRHLIDFLATEAA